LCCTTDSSLCTLPYLSASFSTPILSCVWALTCRRDAGRNIKPQPTRTLPVKDMIYKGEIIEVSCAEIHHMVTCRKKVNANEDRVSIGGNYLLTIVALLHSDVHNCQPINSLYSPLLNLLLSNRVKQKNIFYHYHHSLFLFHLPISCTTKSIFYKQISLPC
jgi:hypothetical protein